MSMHCVHAWWWLWRKEEIESPGSEVTEMVVNHHENAGNRVTRECSLFPSYFFSPLGASL